MFVRVHAVMFLLILNEIARERKGLQTDLFVETYT
jgi:hypothetical protein